MPSTNPKRSFSWFPITTLEELDGKQIITVLLTVDQKFPVQKAIAAGIWYPEVKTLFEFGIGQYRSDRAGVITK
ncbi:MAG: hypothetical protein QHC79_25605 [Pseudosphingobacterium sp.]|nr:hypothetical protein [Pseudosphingobacterium sp.]